MMFRLLATVMAHLTPTHAKAVAGDLRKQAETVDDPAVRRYLSETADQLLVFAKAIPQR
jgi:hypothetical protein